MKDRGWLGTGLLISGKVEDGGLKKETTDSVRNTSDP